MSVQTNVNKIKRIRQIRNKINDKKQKHDSDSMGRSLQLAKEKKKSRKKNAENKLTCLEKSSHPYVQRISITRSK